jgi:hypothetical protein
LAIDNRREQRVLDERLRKSEQSRSLAWQVLQEIRSVLEILGDQRIPYEGEMKRFRAEGDFLLRALINLVSSSRSQIHQLERELTDFEKLTEQGELPREIHQAVHQMMRRCSRNGLSEDVLRGRLDKLRELRILPEDRVHSSNNVTLLLEFFSPCISKPNPC